MHRMFFKSPSLYIKYIVMNEHAELITLHLYFLSVNTSRSTFAHLLHTWFSILVEHLFIFFNFTLNFVIYTLRDGCLRFQKLLMSYLMEWNYLKTIHSFQGLLFNLLDRIRAALNMDLFISTTEINPLGALSRLQWIVKYLQCD